MNSRSKEEKLLEYFKLTGVAKSLRDMYEGIIAGISDLLEDEECDKVRGIIETELLPVQLEDVMQACYDHYSEEDLDAILAFYNSEAGKRLIAKTPEFAKTIAAMTPKWNEILQKHIDELDPPDYAEE